MFLNIAVHWSVVPSFHQFLFQLKSGNLFLVHILAEEVKFCCNLEKLFVAIISWLIVLVLNNKILLKIQSMDKKIIIKIFEPSLTGFKFFLGVLKKAWMYDSDQLSIILFSYSLCLLLTLDLDVAKDKIPKISNQAEMLVVELILHD